MTIAELDRILIDIDYYENFKNNFLNKSYNDIDYGKRLGIKKFNSFFEANDNYAYSNEIEENNFSKWNLILTNEKSTAEELLITCLEIFDWGNVLTGNVKTAVELYKSQKLKPYVRWIKSILPSESTIIDEQLDSDFDDIIIYDSRVSAFLNYTLVSNGVQSNKFSQLTKLLYNFNGAPGRKRQVDKDYGFKNQHPKGINGFNANLISSWIVQLLNRKLNINREVRDYERAFFMLGFDLEQIEN